MSRNGDAKFESMGGAEVRKVRSCDALARTEQFGTGRGNAHRDSAAAAAGSGFPSAAMASGAMAPPWHMDFGITKLYAVRIPPRGSLRTGHLIRPADTGDYLMGVVLRGKMTVRHAGRDATWQPYELMLCDSARPSRTVTAAGTGEVEALAVRFPRAVLPLPRGRVDRLLGTRLPGHEGIGALVVQTLVQMSVEAHCYKPDDTVRLGALVLDLVTALLAHHLDAGPATAESRPRTLFLQIQEFIRQHLGDHHLDLGDIAGAHHISLRYLHRLFARNGLTVAAWIRQQRLERCRRDLADPLLHKRPIHAIAARWGFSRPADFTRAFRSTYHMPPSEYRRLALTVTQK